MIITDRSIDETAFKIPPSAARAGQTFVVLGGGIAGLATARELLKQGCRVTLIEKGAEVGGLARTFSQDGFRFDIGGHRFHSNNPTVVQWLQELLRSNLLVVPRTSHIYLNDRFVDYPIQFPGALSVFSPIEASQMVGSYLSAKVTERQRQERSFEDWVVKRYGRKLYEVFFQPYTEKVWGIPGDRLSSAWASQRIGVPSLRKMLKQALLPPPVPAATAITKFYYPRLGFGMIPEALKQEIITLGGTIYTQTVLDRLIPKVNDQGNEFEIVVQHHQGTYRSLIANQVVSTLPLNLLLQAIPLEWGSQAMLSQYNLEYRDLICLFIALKKRQVSSDSWTYFPSKDLVFGRTHEPKNWSAAMVPSADLTSLAIEIFASRGDELWSLSDAALLERVVRQMAEIGWIDRTEVCQSWVLRVPYAYPVYHMGYQKQLQVVKDYLSQWNHLHLVGRTGSFHYMNSDGVLEDVFRLIARLFPAEASSVRPLVTQVGRWL